MTSNFLARTLERPERALMMLIAAQLAFWTLAPLLSHTAPPLDVVEMQATGREGVIATFKHPNAPGLVLEAARRITGAAGWPAYIVSQICVALTFVAVFALGRELMDARRALMGTLLLTGVYFFSWPTPEFNHNVLQMPLWALTCWALWRASTQGGVGWWVLLGLAGGFSMWAKYSSAILLIAAGLWMLYDAQARRKLLTPGPWLALVVCATTFAPQLLWLIDHDFAPFSYAARRAVTATFVDTLAFLPLQLAHHLPMLLLMLAAGLFGARAAAAPQSPDRRALAFLLIMGLGPAVLLTLVGLVTVSGLRTAWGAPMFNLSGLLAVALLSQRFDEARLRRVFIGAGVLIALTSALYFGTVRYGYQLSGKPLRTNWPQAEISDTLTTAWREETHGAPLRIVAGDIWTAGLIDMSGHPPPHVLINGDYSISSWVTPEDVARYGALVTWSGRQPGALAEFAQGLDTRELEVHAPGPAGRNARPMTIHYVVIPPAQPAN